MRAFAPLGVLVIGCGGVTTAVDAGAIDATETDAAAIDAAVDAVDAVPARCNPSRPFGTPVALSTLNSASDEATPSLTADELNIYFASSRPGGAGGNDIYVASRTAPTAAFGPPALLNGVNSADIESRPILTADGLTLYAEVKRGANPYHIERATRANTGSSFGGLAPVATLNSTSNDVAPFVLPSHAAVYLVSGRGGNADIYRAERTGATFATPVLVTGSNLQSTVNEDYPALSADELTIFFASARAGGVGGADMYVASRPSVAQGFGEPVALAELNTTGGEHPGWISPDGCAFYFGRDVGAQLDLFVALRGM